MAFNLQTFRTRTLTAAVFVVVMLAGLLWNRWSFFVLFSLIHFGCWWEYFRLLEKIHNNRIHHYLKFGLMMLGFGVMIWFCNDSYRLNSYSLNQNFPFTVSGAGFALTIMGIFQKTKMGLKSFFSALSGLIYISLSWGFMMELYAKTDYSFTNGNFTDLNFNHTKYVLPAYFYPITIIISIWINDTMAYIVGSLIGKTTFTKISPKKTVEGTLGGLFLSSVAIFLLSKIYFSNTQLNILITGIAVVASVFGTAGDLFESKLKRLAGVKDSGRIMPGHGGFLDRFDSLLFATPFVWAFVYIFLN